MWSVLAESDPAIISLLGAVIATLVGAVVFMAKGIFGRLLVAIDGLREDVKAGHVATIELTTEIRVLQARIEMVHATPSDATLVALPGPRRTAP